MNQNRAKLALWLRVDGTGTVIPSASQLRPIKDIKGPRDGRWIRVQSNYCCTSLDSYLVFRNTTASANITAISYTGFSWSGTLANGDYLVTPIPNGYNEVVSVTVDTPSGRTITTATKQGSGTITAGGVITLATNVYDTSATPASQYTVILS